MGIRVAFEQTTALGRQPPSFQHQARGMSTGVTSIFVDEYHWPVGNVQDVFKVLVPVRDVAGDMDNFNFDPTWSDRHLSEGQRGRQLPTDNSRRGSALHCIGGHPPTHPLANQAIEIELIYFSSRSYLVVQRPMQMQSFSQYRVQPRTRTRPKFKFAIPSWHDLLTQLRTQWTIKPWILGIS